jgi:hypothetical protein
LEDLFPPAAQMDCNKRQDERGDSLLNGVMLNKLQDWRKNNELDYSGLILSNFLDPNHNLILKHVNFYFAGKIFGPGVVIF